MTDTPSAPKTRNLSSEEETTLTTDTDTGFRLTRDQLECLRPHVLSRWAARVFSFGELRFEPDHHVLGLDTPAIVRSSPSVGPALAASCVGRPVNSMFIREHDMRGGWTQASAPPGVDPDRYSVVGFLDAASADAHGIVASFFVLSADLHDDLVMLDKLGQLDAAGCCLSSAVTSATVRRTGWGLPVVDVLDAEARSLSLTSLSHDPGGHVIRRLAEDEPLGARDFVPPAREWAPRAWPSAEAAPLAGRLVPLVVTPAKRSPVGELDIPWTLLASETKTLNFFGFGGAVPLPNVNVISGNTNVAAILTTINVNGGSFALVNLTASPQSGTAKVVYW
jgi:hypothetical protein